MELINRIIRLVIIDDYDLGRKGIAIALMLFADIRLVGEAASGEEGLHLCELLQPHVVLVDLVMPGMDGIETIQRIRHAYPHIQAIALTGYDDLQRKQAALEVGAYNYMAKDTAIDELALMIRRAASQVAR